MFHLLTPDTRSPLEALNVDGQEKVVIPTPRNVVNLATRMIASEPRIEALAASPSEGHEQKAAKRAAWLTAFWQQTNKEQGENLLDKLKLQGMVLARPTLEIKWVYDVLPESMKDKRLPFLARWLDPRNVGISRGPLYVDYAYHKYEEPLAQAAQRYPQVREMDKYQNRKHGGAADHNLTIEISDFWWRDPKGEIWNAVLADEEFVKPLKKTRYPDIPIMQTQAEQGLARGESISFLDSIRELWHYQNRLHSQVGTGLLYYYWPIMTITNESGGETPDFKIRPGETYPLPKGVSINILRPEPSIPMAQFMMGQVDQYIQQATFPAVMFGKEPGEVQAGYGINILANQARGRMNQIREQIEMLMETANQFLLKCIEKFPEKDRGVSVWGMSEREGKPLQFTIKASDISGYYENEVNLVPDLPEQDNAKIMTGMQMVEKGMLSIQTFWERILNLPLPSDEKIRIAKEQAMKAPELQAKEHLRAVQIGWPSTWRDIIAGTPLEQLAQQEEQRAMERKAQAEAEKRAKEEAAAAEEAATQNGGLGPLPPGMMPPGMESMMGGPPPGMMPPPGMPPPGMMPPGMDGGMPPGMMPPPGGGPPSMQPPGLEGMPAQMMGQMSPEALGMTPQLEQGMPGAFQQMMGQPPLSEAEQIRRLANLR